MASLLIPPESPHSSEAPDVELKQLHIADSSPDLLESLDSLLERYLRLLDQHQRLQGELASKLASGFFSLTQANYSCPPGRRYGADYYDERMKATRKIVLQPGLSLDADNRAAESDERSENATRISDFRHYFAIEPRPSIEKGKKPEGEDQIEEPQLNEKAPEDERPDNPEDRALAGSTLTNRDSSASQVASEEPTAARLVKKKARSSDPIRWYGILVSPFLRSAQKSFTEAVDDQLLDLASVIVEMRYVEKEISRLRTELEQ